MKKILKKKLRNIAVFISNQSLVLFLSLTLAAKLYYINTFVINVAQPDYYVNGILCCLFSAIVIFLPFLFIKNNKFKNIAALVFALLISVILFVDTVYYSYFLEIPSVGLLSLIGSGDNVRPAIIALIKIEQFIYFIDIILVVIIAKPISLLFSKAKEKYGLKNSSIISAIFFFVVSIILLASSLLYFGADSLSTLYTKGYNNAYISRHYGVLVGHTIDIMRYIQQEMTNLSKSETSELVEWVNQNKPEQQISSLNGAAKNANIILIQVESLGGFVINQAINNEEITPNLNKLIQSTSYFSNSQFITGGGHTSDTDFVVNTSYFPLEDSAVFVRYGLDDFTSLPKTLLANGYNSTNFYHGYIRSFWNRDIALQSLGYQKFYADDNYAAGTTLNMGLSDGEFLNETIGYIKEQPEPSLSSVVTLSSHTPFDITDLTNDLDLGQGDYPNQIAGYLENIHYVDKVLGEFLDKLKAEDLYDKSLIILYGDHTPVLDSFTAGSITYNPDSNQGKEVPMFIKLPNQTTGATYTGIGTSLDIMPTIFDLTGIQTDQLMFGQSLFAQTEGKVAACPNHLMTFTALGNCDEAELTEKNISSKIIRYNQFEHLN